MTQTFIDSRCKNCGKLVSATKTVERCSDCENQRWINLLWEKLNIDFPFEMEKDTHAIATAIRLLEDARAS